MQDVFESRLKRMVAEAERRAERDLNTLIEDLGETAYLIMTEGGESKVSEKRRKALCRGIRDKASILNACEFVKRTVFTARNGFSRTIQLGRIEPRAGLRPAQDKIDRLFAKREVPDRGLCYVAWTGSPEEFYYVGKADSKKRLDLRRHGLLAASLKWARRVSLVFPGAKSQVSGLEASLQSIITAVTGEKPKLNVRVERVPDGRTSRELDSTSFYLEDMAADLSPVKAPRKALPAMKGNGKLSDLDAPPNPMGDPPPDSGGGQ